MHQILAGAGYLLEVILLWRLLTWRAWRHFPVFFSYFLFLLARQGFLAFVEARYGTNSNAHALWFWSTTNFADVLKMLVAWEVFRRVFRPGSAAQRFGAVLLVVILLGLSAFYVLGGAHETPFFVAVGLNFSFVVTVWIACVLALAQYYRLPLGGNVWGIALGLGLYSATAVINFSALGLDPSTFPIATYVRPTSFVLSVFIWTWCLWSYRPAPDLPPPASSAGASGSEEPLEATKEAVDRAMGLRKP